MFTARIKYTFSAESRELDSVVRSLARVKYGFVTCKKALCAREYKRKSTCGSL